MSSQVSSTMLQYRLPLQFSATLVFLAIQQVSNPNGNPTIFTVYCLSFLQKTPIGSSHLPITLGCGFRVLIVHRKDSRPHRSAKNFFKFFTSLTYFRVGVGFYAIATKTPSTITIRQSLIFLDSCILSSPSTNAIRSSIVASLLFPINLSQYS